MRERAETRSVLGKWGGAHRISEDGGHLALVFALLQPIEELEIDVIDRFQISEFLI